MSNAYCFINANQAKNEKLTLEIAELLKNILLSEAVEKSKEDICEFGKKFAQT